MSRESSVACRRSSGTDDKLLLAALALSMLRFISLLTWTDTPDAAEPRRSAILEGAGSLAIAECSLLGK